MSYFDQYSKEEIQQIVALSTSLKDFAQKIGYSHSPSGDTQKMLKDRLKSFNTSHFQKSLPTTKLSFNQIFIENSAVSQSVLRRHYKKGQYTEYKCSICNQEPFWNGKELTLILDHINGINNDDRLENLRWVCPNCNQQLDTTGSKNPARRKFVKKFYCVDCGKEITKNCTRCLACASKQRIVPLEEMQVTRDELKFLIRNKTFIDIGKQFHVSDNTIRKWCDKFNLPRKKTEIKNYSDEEWALI